MKLLTTITPYWGRPTLLKRWLDNLRQSYHPQVLHHIYFVGEETPQWVEDEYGRDSGFFLSCFPECRPGEFSIGYYHNFGAQLISTPWMMKLDVDAFPNRHYFSELLPLLFRAPKKKWFNGGMLYLTPDSTRHLSLPLTDDFFQAIVRHIKITTLSPHIPAASNFICKTQDYLSLGGCDPRFSGYGWEDYQQLYMLEGNEQGRCPLGGELFLRNITQRCRDEISRRKAQEFWSLSPWLCLLHHWHPTNRDTNYRSSEKSDANKRVLLEYCLERRKLWQT